MSKYGNHRFKADGYSWDSKAEYYRWGELRLLEIFDHISALEVKPKFVLLKPFTRDGVRYRGITYIADFSYIQDGVYIVEDCKGAKTAVYKMKKQLLLAQYPSLTFVESAA